MLAMHALREIDTLCQLIVCYTERLPSSETYNDPTAKTAETPTLRSRGSCSSHIELSGNKNADMSVMVFVTADTRKAAPRSMHRPPSVGVHILRRGMH